MARTRIRISTAGYLNYRNPTHYPGFILEKVMIIQILPHLTSSALLTYPISTPLICILYSMYHEVSNLPLTLSLTLTPNL